MDNYQKVEQIVNKTGCSYEDAKAALEGCEWDMLDAVISLERDGKIKNEAADQKAEDAVEIIPEVSTDIVSEGSSRNSSDDSTQEKAESSKDTGEKKNKHGLWKRIKGIMLNNRMVVLKQNGQQIMDLPIIFPVIALIAFFWVTLILAVIAMIFGCRFHFEGEDLGKASINNTMDKATDYAEKVKNDLTGKTNGEQNTDN